MNAEQPAINAAVTARVRSFEAAERARDAEGLVSHYASVPEFYFYHDGRRPCAKPFLQFDPST